MEFVEVGLRDVVALTDAEFESLLARSRALKLPVRAAINFLPTDLKVVGPEIDVAAQRTYLAGAFARAKRLGLQTVVFGSGKSRRSPEGFAPTRRSASWSSSGAWRPPWPESTTSSSPSNRWAPTRPTPSTTWRRRCAW